MIAFVRRLILRPSAAYLLTSALTKVGSLLLVPFYTRAMTVEAYGDYALALTVLSLGPAFVLGLPTALTKSYFDVKDPQEARLRFGGVAKLLVAAACVVAVLGEIAILILAKDSGSFLGQRGLTCVNVATWGTTLLAIPIQFSRDTQRPLVATVFQIAEFALSFGLGITLAYVLRRGLIGALETLALTYGLLGLLSIAYVFRVLGGLPTPPLMKFAFSFSLPYVPHFLAVWVQGVAERWVMKAVGREAELGSYAIASQLAAPVNLFVMSWNLERSARTGELYREEGREGLKRELPGITRGYLLISMLPSLLVSISLPIVPLILGEKYGNVIYYAPFLLIAIIIEACYCPPNQVAYYTGHSGRIATATVASAGAAIATSVVLVPLLGVWGAVLTRIVSATVRTGAMWYAARQCLQPTPSTETV